MKKDMYGSDDFNKRSILYIGDGNQASNSCLRAVALRRIGCDVTVVDPSEFLGTRRRYQYFWDYRTGFRFLQDKLLKAFQADVKLASQKVDLIWVNGGELIGPRLLAWLLDTFKCSAVLYNNDDPTGWRDGSRFAALRSSLPFYSLCAFCRLETALEALALGAKRILRSWMSYDEEFCFQALICSNPSIEETAYFIGTLIPGEARDKFLLDLKKSGLPLAIFGDRWRRSSDWPSLAKIYRGPGLSGKSYSFALRSAAVTLGLLSHQNRDLVTGRSFETPACGGLLCAERTSEHQLLYEEDREAVFWSSGGECLEQCQMLLADFRLNQAIRAASQKQVYRLGVGNEDICRQILAVL